MGLLQDADDAIKQQQQIDAARKEGEEKAKEEAEAEQKRQEEQKRLHDEEGAI